MLFKGQRHWVNGTEFSPLIYMSASSFSFFYNSWKSLLFNIDPLKILLINELNYSKFLKIQTKELSIKKQTTKQNKNRPSKSNAVCLVYIFIAANTFQMQCR